MQMHPWDYYNYHLPEFDLKRQGWREQQIDDERIFRRLGLLSVSPWADKKFDIYKAWPIENDDQIQNKGGSEDGMWERLIQRARKLKEEENNGG